MHERVICSIAAAAKYQVPANIVLAIAEKEGGRAGQWVRNHSNGSFDVGSMQFNTEYLKDLAKYGITADHVASAGCFAFELGAWRLRMHIKNDKGDIWTRAANYHSRTPRFNQVYRADLIVRADKWAKWLAARYTTLDVSSTSMQMRAEVSTPALHPGVLSTGTRHSGSVSRTGYVPRQIIASAAR